jgi:hypothetical protein
MKITSRDFSAAAPVAAVEEWWCGGVRCCAVWVMKLRSTLTCSVRRDFSGAAPVAVIKEVVVRIV